MKPIILSIASLAILGLFCNPLLAQSNSTAEPAETKPVSNNSIELPIQLYRDYLVVVEGSIGNLETLAFIIDTGAYPSMVDQRISAALGLKERDGKVGLVNQSVQVKLATLPTIAVGFAHVENLPVLVRDLSPFEKTLGRRIDAVVGLDVLCKTSFDINYRTKRLRFGPVQRSRSTASFETGPSFVIVEARLHDRTVRLLVDTGASALMLFQSRLSNPISLPAGRLAKATNVGGDFQRQAILIPEMHLGKENLGPQRGFMVADQRDDGRDFDGVLSVRGLYLEEIGFDFENHEINWKK
jgi:hypothetical protein